MGARRVTSSILFLFMFVCLLETALASHHGNGVDGAQSVAPRQAGIVLPGKVNKALCTLGCTAEPRPSQGLPARCSTRRVAGL
jgi:hypothetical protein